MSRRIRPAIVFANIDAIRICAPTMAERHARALASLADEQIRVVLCTYRSRAQLEGVRAQLGVYHPFIVENGAAAFVPVRYFGTDLERGRTVGGYQAIEFAGSYDRVVETAHKIADRLHVAIVGFRDMSVEQVARVTGMTLLEARLAKLREYDEPFQLLPRNPIAQQRLVHALLSAGLVCVERNEFIHAGTSVGPGTAVTAIAALYLMTLGPVMTLAWDPDDSAAIGRRTEASLSLGVPPSLSMGATEWLEAVLEAVCSARLPSFLDANTATTG